MTNQTQKEKISPILGIPLAIIIGLGLAFAGKWAYSEFANQGQESIAEISNDTVLLRMVGTFDSQGAIDADVAVPSIKAVCSNPKIKTVVFYLASEGGSAVEAERISKAITRYCGKKDTVALIEGSCLSSCYQVAVRAKAVFANQYSHVGSIGAMMGWTDYSKQLSTIGVEERQITSGSKKGGSFGNMMPNQEQHADLQMAVNTSGKAFVAEVNLFRKGKIAKDAKIEDGGIYSGQDALDAGLVDGFQTIDEIRDRYTDLKELGAVYTGRVVEAKQTKSERKLKQAMEKARNANR